MHLKTNAGLQPRATTHLKHSVWPAASRSTDALRITVALGSSCARHSPQTLRMKPRWAGGRNPKISSHSSLGSVGSIDETLSFFVSFFRFCERRRKDVVVVVRG